MNEWMWRLVKAEEINRQAPRAKRGANRARNRLGQLAWADRLRPILARFGPVSLLDASRSIVDLLPYLRWALNVVFSMVWIELLVAQASASSVQVPGVFRLRASVPGPFGVMFMVCLDLCRAS
jgi:hypothetical protein